MGFPEVSVGSENRTKRLLECVLAVSSGLDLDETLRRILQVAVDLVGARYGVLGLLGSGEQTDRFAYVGIADASDVAIRRWLVDRECTALDLQDPESVRLDDATGCSAFPGLPADHPAIVTFLGVPIQWENDILGRLCIMDKADSQSFTDDDEVTVKAVAGAVGIAMNYAKEIEEALRGKQWLEASGDVSTRLLDDGDAMRALRLIAERALELSASDTAMVMLPSDSVVEDDSVTDLRIAVCAGADASVLLDLVIPAEGSTSGAVLADHQPRKIDVPFHRSGVPIVLGPAMAVPLTPEASGPVLMVVRTSGSVPFGDDDLTRLSGFAENASLALHLSATQRRRELRVLADRDRLARDLYDHVVQQLFAVGLAMQITRRRPRSSSDTRMGEHIDQVQSVIRELRQAIFDLPQARVTSPRVRTLLAQMVTSLTVDSPQAVTLRMTGSLDDLPADLAQHARAVLSEAVGNAVRHSRADELTISISVDDDLGVDVSDNGIGIGDAGEGVGLTRLRQLATTLAGTFTVDQPDTGGTHVGWSAPLP